MSYILDLEYSSETEPFSKFVDLQGNRQIYPFTEDSFDILMGTAEISEEVYENRQESVSQQYYELRSTTKTYPGTYDYVFLENNDYLTDFISCKVILNDYYLDQIDIYYEHLYRKLDLSTLRSAFDAWYGEVYN